MNHGRNTDGKGVGRPTLDLNALWLTFKLGGVIHKIDPVFPLSSKKQNL